MLFHIWKWLTGPSKEELAKNLLLTRCIRNRYLKQKNSILIIQKYTRQYLANLEREEDIFLRFQSLIIKDRNKLLA